MVRKSLAAWRSQPSCHSAHAPEGFQRQFFALEDVDAIYETPSTITVSQGDPVWVGSEEMIKSERMWIAQNMAGLKGHIPYDSLGNKEELLARSGLIDEVFCPRASLGAFARSLRGKPSRGAFAGNLRAEPLQRDFAPQISSDRSSSLVGLFVCSFDLCLTSLLTGHQLMGIRLWKRWTLIFMMCGWKSASYHSGRSCGSWARSGESERPFLWTASWWWLLSRA